MAAERTENDLAREVVDAALSVHREVGPGLLEKGYEHCLAYELRERGLHVIQQQPLPATYKEVDLDLGYRLDLWVEKKIIVEVKAVESLQDVHMAQLPTYLKLTKNKPGLLITFNVPLIKQGIQRVVNGL
ncbi:MAG: GxxExxY protein [Flavobacteriales bacterium]|nr:GxxExxY protein [Flavobacteriales bacterium]